MLTSISQIVLRTKKFSTHLSCRAVVSKSMSLVSVIIYICHLSDGSIYSSIESSVYNLSLHLSSLHPRSKHKMEKNQRVLGKFSSVSLTILIGNYFVK